jgi:hypothetical protein
MPMQLLVEMNVSRPAVMEAVLGVSESELFYVAVLVEVLKRDHGCTTPAENFITQILMGYNCRGLRQSDVLHELAAFDEQLNEALETAKMTVERYEIPIERKEGTDATGA